MNDYRGNKVSRRDLLQYMAWAGAGVCWGIRSGTPISVELAQAKAAMPAGFTFIQMSDTHIGFNQQPNPDSRVTSRQAIAQIKALPQQPAFIIHTGDISHLSKEQEFDDAEQIMRAAGLPVFYIAGEHDLLDDDNGKAYLRRFGKGTHGTGWYSFDSHGIHFVGLINVADLTAGGMGHFGDEQLRWLANDLRGRAASTPVVAFAHMPLWAVYPQWGWGTQDGAQALSYLRRFGSVTVLTGHTHQAMRKVEGNLVLHTAASTSFPEPPPGQGPAPEPMNVPAGELHNVLGISSVSLVQTAQRLAVTDLPLAESPLASSAATPAAAAAADSGDASGAQTVRIANFAYGPVTVTIPAGTSVKWLNGDNFPHNVVAADKSFKSKTLAGGDEFSLTFAEPGEYSYFCSLHPYMTGKVIVKPREIRASR